MLMVSGTPRMNDVHCTHMRALRTEATADQYRQYRKAHQDGACWLCDKPSIRSFGSWMIVENTFPYDLIAQTHHLLMPKRHVARGSFSEEERSELDAIIRQLSELGYDYFIETLGKTSTVPDHFHLHLIIGH
jgi:hypothetical protein